MNEFFSEHEIKVEADALALLPRQICLRLKVLPLALHNGTLRVVMAEPDNLLAADEITRRCGLRLEVSRAPADVIQRAILKYYDDDDSTPVAAPAAPDVLARLVSEAPAVAAVNDLLRSAVAQRATDIHIEPQERNLLVRFRVDGVMYDQTHISLEVHPSIVSRVKILAHLDIAERRLPQDGRFEYDVGGRDFDIRVSTVPTITGEYIALRLLPKQGSAMALEDLGLSPAQLRTVSDLITRPYGMILATGPTGSGKTTTLYACLTRVDRAATNVITLEEPVEYRIARVAQIPVYPKIGLTFALGLRHILRQDPDVLMVGEVRDLETVQMAIQSALTGHLLFSTLHCNDACGAPVRLLDMGAEPFLVSSSLAAVIAQRLLRRICVNCKEQFEPTQETRERLGLAQGLGPFYRGRGCAACRGTGYRGMIGVFELLALDDELRAAIVRKVSAGELRGLARDRGIPTLRDDGMGKALLGVTTLEEVLRAVYLEV